MQCIVPYEKIEFFYIHDFNPKNSLIYLCACDRGYDKIEAFKLLEALKFQFMIKFRRDEIYNEDFQDFQERFVDEFYDLYEKWNQIV